jgi:hypothetical protein
VTSDGDFAYVQVSCGHVTCKRDGDRIVLVAGPDCRLIASGSDEIVSIAVNGNKDKVIALSAFRAVLCLDHGDNARRIAANLAKLPEL